MKYHPYVWPAHQSHGKRFDLTHLDAFTFIHVAPARAHGPGRPTQPALSVSVNVAFSHHCFTNSPTQPHYDPSDIYAFFSDPRSFCALRYQHTLNFNLQAWVKKLPAARCFRTNHNNGFAVVGPLANKSGYYVAYFRVEAASAAAPYSVNVLVESAYLKPKLPIVGRGAHQEAFLATVVRILGI